MLLDIVHRALVPRKAFDVSSVKRDGTVTLKFRSTEAHSAEEFSEMFEGAVAVYRLRVARIAPTRFTVVVGSEGSTRTW
jgi:hypothetical protein